MKPPHSIRVSLIVCIVLMCMAFGVYSFVRLNALDERRDFDLCTLVPQDVEAVFATDKLTDFIEAIDCMGCSRDHHFLYASDLFSCVKRYLRMLMEREPHGLSGQMNEMLISFHPSDLKNDQVLYCKLGLEDREMLENYIKQYGSSSFPSKTFGYRGQEISIYSLSDGRFLSLWMKRDFLVVSFQKRLVEQVIDTWKSGESLFRLENFRPAVQARQEARQSVLFLRWKNLGEKLQADSANYRDVWLEFDMKLSEEGIYCAGVAYGVSAADTCRYAFAGCHPVAGFPGVELPQSTLLHRCEALPVDMTGWQHVLSHCVSDSLTTAEGERFDHLLVAYLLEHAQGQVVSCSFSPSDSSFAKPRLVVGIALKDVGAAQRDLHTLLYDISQGQYPFYKNFSAVTGIGGMRLYRLPSGCLIAKLAADKRGQTYGYATFYQNRLLIAAEEDALAAYVKELKQKNCLERSPVYGAMVEQLSPVYDFVLMADMETMALDSLFTTGMLPSFFETHFDFFRHFQLAIQVCRVDGVICPNIVLLYRLKDAVSESS